jgi:hypothetical protein
MINSNKVLKLLLVFLFLGYPSIIYAHGEQMAIVGLFSFAYILFAGLIFGLIEYKIFAKYSNPGFKAWKIILINYLVFDLTYFVFIFFVEAMEREERMAVIKLLISIIVFFGIIVGVKYKVYQKHFNESLTPKNILLRMLISNVLLPGLFFYLIFDQLLWFFGG